MDISKQVTNNSLGPFLTGAICSNLAWLCIWPLDVVKTQMQSGQYAGKGLAYLVRDVLRTGILFKGILPGEINTCLSSKLIVVYNVRYF